ncbi:HNH endonuclease [Streptomyces sp. Tu10]|uniref:HNH endonuclease n=1 Tax=Streptomyces sp. Tu10 TaxID=2838018 RepID=UPI002543F43B|nr:HNH endonuclease signature motif containing protein [Streptomyces sp. Tu10]
MARRRRRFRTWEWLCVLEANEGCCVYCGARSQTMDHVIPFSAGGTDHLSNLVPACYDCNRRKSDRTPVEWFVGMDLTSRWDGKGTPQGGAIAGGSLRDLYLSVHNEVLELLDLLDEVAAEIADTDRRSWFLRSCPWSYPSSHGGLAFTRAWTAERIQAGKAAGWPDMHPDKVTQT